MPRGNPCDQALSPETQIPRWHRLNDFCRAAANCMSSPYSFLVNGESIDPVAVQAYLQARSSQAAADRPVMGLKLRYFDKFSEIIAGCAQYLTGMTGNDVYHHIILPATASHAVSFCDLLEAVGQGEFVAAAEVYVSHAWGYDFLDVIDALKLQFPHAPDTVVWLDMFCSINDGGVYRFDHEMQRFQVSLMSCKSTIVVFAPWNDPVPLTRAWCLFEIYFTSQIGHAFAVAMSSATRRQFLTDICNGAERSFNAMLAAIDVNKVSAFDPSYAIAILKIIHKDSGMDAITARIFECFRALAVSVAKDAIRDEQQSAERLLRVKMGLADLYYHQGNYADADIVNAECLQLKKQIPHLIHADAVDLPLLNCLQIEYTASSEATLHTPRAADDAKACSLGDGAGHTTEQIAVKTHDYPTHGVRLSYLDEFIASCKHRLLSWSALQVKDGFVAKSVSMEGWSDEQKLAKWETLTTDEVAANFIVNVQHHPAVSHCQMLVSTEHDAVEEANVFISHTWGNRFSDLVQAIQNHFTAAADPDAVVLWLDLFSNNQHDTSSKDFSWWTGAFKNAIGKFHHTVMVFAPWYNPISLTRAWCLWELYCTSVTGSKFEVAMSNDNKAIFLQNICKDAVKAVDKMLASIDVEKSAAGRAQDQANILQAVRASVGFDKLNAVVFDHMRQWVIETTKRELHSAAECCDRRGSLLLKHALADLYHHQGMYSRATTLYLECQQLSAGDASPLASDESIVLMNNLAVSHHSRCKYSSASELFAQCLSACRTRHGDNHPHTLIIKNNFSCLLRNLGKHDEALALNSECLKQQRIALGAKHPDTLLSICNAALLHKKSDSSMETTRSLFAECWEASSKVLGTNHPTTLLAMHGLAEVFARLGHYERSLSLHMRCLTHRKASLGETHPYTLVSMSNLATVLLEDGLQKSQLVLGLHHPVTVAMRNNLTALQEKTS